MKTLAEIINQCDSVAGIGHDILLTPDDWKILKSAIRGIQNAAICNAEILDKYFFEQLLTKAMPSASKQY